MRDANRDRSAEPLRRAGRAPPCWLSFAILTLLFLLTNADRSFSEEERFRGRTLEEWTADLKHENWSVRYAAAEMLGGLREKAKSSIPDLVLLLRDGDFCVRIAGAGALARMGPLARDAFPRLKEALQDRHAEVRGAVLESLGSIGAPIEEVLPLEIEGLRSAVDPVRRGAFRGVAALGPDAEGAVPALTDLLESRDSWVRHFAADCLGAVGRAAAPAVPFLLEWTRLEDEDHVLDAVRTLGRIGSDPETVVPRLMELADGASPRVRAAAVRALGDFGIEAAEAIPVLVRILAVGGDDGGNWDGGNWGHSLRRDAEEALVCVGAPAVAPLLPFLGTADPNLGRAVVAILSRIGEPALLPVLAALSEPDPAIRAAAAAVLGNLGSPRAVPALAELVSDPDDRIRTAAGNALSRLGEKAATVALKALSDPDPGRRRWAVGALAALPGETGLEGILGALDDKETAVREAAVRALGRKGTLGLPALLRLLEAPDERTKDLAVHAMGAMRPPPADAVAALLPGAGPDKRLSLALALAGMDDDRGVPPLVECLSGRIPGSGSRAAWALRRLGGRAVPHLLSVLKEGPAPARYHAAVALGGIRGSGTGPALAEALKDPDPLVRASAAEGLVRKEEELLPPAVEEALRSPAPETRFWAAVVRAHRSPAWDPGPLLEGLRLAPLLEEEVDARVRDLEGEGRRPFVRGLYVEAIRRTLPESARLLVERMTDPDEGTRAAAKEVLDCLRPDVESALLEGAKGGSGTRRYACLRILMEWRCPAAAGPALSALKDPEPEVRRIAASLLGALEAREAVEPLIALLEDDDWTVVFSAAAALRRITGLNLGRSPAEWRSRLEREKRGREEGR